MLKTIVLILIITLAIAIVGMTIAMIYFIRKKVELSKSNAVEDEAEQQKENQDLSSDTQ